jgi:hypothetical protein
MGKDKTGKYHPPKGKPSGVNKEEGLGLSKTIDPEKFEEHERLTERYTDGENQLSADVRIRHVNRNVNKGSSTTSRDKNPDKTTTERFEENDVQSAVPEEMPGMFNKELFKELAGFQSECCVTFFVQTNDSGVEVNEQKDNIQFKNVLQEVEKRLREKGVEEGAIKGMLNPGYDLLRDEQFWKQQGKGLAVFLSNMYFRYIKMPLVPSEEIIIDKTFFVSPLVPLMTNNDYFYLLVLSKKQAKLFRAGAFGMQFIEIPEIPNGVDDVVHFEEKEDQKLFRTGGRGGTGGANFHGIGAGKPDEKTHISLYFEEVDDTIWEHVLRNETAPLLLAGVEYLIPLYKSVSDYNFIWENALTGSFESEPTASLYPKAMEKMQPYFRQRIDKALNLFGNQSATSLTSTDAREVIAAAHYARVSHLFVQKDAHIWGSFDEMDDRMTIHDEQAPDDESLLDHAVEKTILNGGEVYTLSKEEMPAGALVAAVLRY